jgi:hypothetical protein
MTNEELINNERQIIQYKESIEIFKRDTIGSKTENINSIAILEKGIERLSEESRKQIEGLSEESRKQIEAQIEELNKEFKEKIEKLNKQKETKTKTDNQNIGCFIIIVLIVFFVLILKCSKNSTIGTPEERIKLNCAVLAEKGVKANLKSPATAEFNYSSGNYNDYVQLISKTDSIFEVTGTCDAENSFGAKLRQEFTVKIKKENNLLEIIDVKIY